MQKFDVPLAEATTSSLEALKALHPRQEDAEDPNFAMGFVAVGDNYMNLSQVGRASEYYTKAFQLRDHTIERERLAITAMYYSYVVGDLDKATQAYHESIENYPQIDSNFGNLGSVYAEQGQYEKAVDVTREAVRLWPNTVSWYENLGKYAVALQRFDDARQIIHEAQARKLDDYIVHNALCALAFLTADAAAMTEQEQWFASKPEYEHVGVALVSDTEAYAGHVSQARDLTKRAVDSAIRADSRENGAIW